MDVERYQALEDKLDKLLTYDFIKESFYPSWLENPMLVKKLVASRGSALILLTSTKLAQRQLFASMNRSARGCDLRELAAQFYGCLLKI